MIAATQGVIEAKSSHLLAGLSRGGGIGTVAREAEPVSLSRTIRQVLDCADVGVEVATQDPALLDFVVEFFDPWFRPTQRSPEWSIDVVNSATAYAKMREITPADATLQPCFANDEQVLSLPAWGSGDVINVCDSDRSCYLQFRADGVSLIGDPRTRRWRFTLLCAVQQIAATRLRQTHLDLHAAAVERAGRALVIAGAKNAGKTTLSFYLMESRRWAWIANDRTFIGGDAAVPTAVGMPTAAKIRPPTLSRFPQLDAPIRRVARPYLYSSAELQTAAESEEPLEAVGFFALTPKQIAARFGARTCAGAPLRVLVLPRICDNDTTWSIEPLTTGEIVAGIGGNFYGAATGGRPATLFERRGGGQHHATSAQITAVAAKIRGYRVRLGSAAYADDSLSRSLLQLLTSD